MQTAGEPWVDLKSLDEVWFQVGGTLCNLSCAHCFISCNPSNKSFGFLTLETVRRFLEESAELGAKEYYFTGGEPFLNRELLSILEETLRWGPATVLTNGTAFRERLVRELSSIASASRYSLEIRVSIDGPSAETNDPIRGEGTFEAALQGVRLLSEASFLPIITMMQSWPDSETLEVLRAFTAELKRRGCERPRFKILPALRIGMEAKRTRGYRPDERVSAEMLEGYDVDQLICSHSRTVTDRGVAVCPILIEAPGVHLGATLREASRPFAVSRPACFTCYLFGSICTNVGSSTAGGDR